jgi:transposase-like protein
MADIFETTIICEDCNKRTVKNEIFKDGFRLRSWECKNCGKKWYHPADKQEYEEFLKLKEKQFQVKLRMVGNSYTISIPREIIDFEEEFNREINKLISLTMDEPGKVSLFLHKKLTRIYKK